MTPDEAAFLDALARAPDDETARLVYADWLDEHDRSGEAAVQRTAAPGYRALAHLERAPETSRNVYASNDTPGAPPLAPDEHQRARASTRGYVWWRSGCNSIDHEFTTERLPPDWFDLVRSNYVYGNRLRHGDPVVPLSKDFFTLEEALCEAALAFAGLPPDRRHHLLTAPAAEVFPASAEKGFAWTSPMNPNS